MNDATPDVITMAPNIPRSAARLPTAAGWITIQQLSQLSGLSVSTLRRRLKDGSIHAKQLGGKKKKIIFDPHDWEGPALQGKGADQSPTALLASPQPLKHPTESTAAWMRSAHFLGDTNAQNT